MQILNIAPLLVRWCRETAATAMMETVILFPVLLTLLMGCFDIGRGIVLNQKVIGASQVMADLVARYRNVDTNLLDDIVAAGRLALEPSNTTPFGYDIVSLEINNKGQPVVLWRITKNTDKNDDALQKARDLVSAGDGVIIVTTTYQYRPNFSNFLVDTINMKEVAFLRGRRSATVTCNDC
jgi:Flp pilus assembly protein TadG